MAIRGRPPKPTELKRRLGNPGKRALPATVVALAPVVLTRAPDVPEEGHELLDFLRAAGASAWISATDGAKVQLAIDDWNARARLREFIEENGYKYMSESKVSGVQWHPWPEVLELREVEKRLDSRFSSLGLDTVARSRLGVAEVKARSKLEQLRERARQQRDGLPPSSRPSPSRTSAQGTAG